MLYLVEEKLLDNSILDNDASPYFSNTVAEKFLKTRYKGPNFGVSVSSALRTSVSMRGEWEWVRREQI